MAELGFEPGTLAFEDHCSTTELQNPSYFFGKKLLNTPIIFAKNSGPSNQLGEKALGPTLYSSALASTNSQYDKIVH